MTLIAKVGMNIGKYRFEPGDKITVRLTDKQEAEMIKQGDAEKVETKGKEG